MSTKEILQVLEKLANDPEYQKQRKVTETSLELALSLMESFKKLEELDKFDKATIAAFQTGGWPVTPSISTKLRKEIVELHKTKNLKRINQLILGYFHRNDFLTLRELVSDWENHKLFTQRMHIFRDALEAHCSKKYTLSVTALMPQIEGILSDLIKQYDKELEVSYGKVKKVYTAIVGNPDEFDRWEISHTLLFILENNLYAHTDLRKEIKRAFKRRKITRHTILHGFYVNYNKPTISLKQFLILDAISGLSYWFKSDNNKE